LNSGDEVELVSQDNDWYKINFNGQTGYASSKYLQFSRTADTTANNDLEKSEETKNTYIVVGVIIGVILLIIFLASSGKKNPQPQTNISSPTVTQQQSQPRVIVTKSTKGVGTAVFLVVIFGPLGMFYSTIGGAILMTIAAPIIFIMLLMSGNIGSLIFAAIIYYPVCMIWAGSAASSYNQKIINEANK